MELPKNIKDDIWDFCRLNNITDLDSFVLKLVQIGFNIEKYGNAPYSVKPEVIEKIVEKEVIKEIVIEKEVKISDDVQINELLNKISKLSSELQLKDDEITRLRLELEEEKSKIKKEDKDIYGESKKGFFGSNISDIWNKQKR